MGIEVREMIGEYPKIIKGVLCKGFPVSFIQQVHLWGPTVCQVPLCARDRSCEEACTPFPAEPQRILRGEEGKLVARLQSWEGGMLCSTFLAENPTNCPKPTYTPRTPCTCVCACACACARTPPHTHTTHTCTCERLCWRALCGSSSQLQMQHANCAIDTGCQPQCLTWRLWH